MVSWRAFRDASPMCLRSLGINQGSRVFTIMGRTPELYITIMGAFRVDKEDLAYRREPAADGGDLALVDRLRGDQHVGLADIEPGGNWFGAKRREQR